MTAYVIHPNELLELYDRGPIRLVDVRTPVEFQTAHVEFARNVPLDQLNPAEFSGKDARAGTPVVFVCQSGSRGQKACDELRQAGITDVFNVAGGTKACIDAGLPIVYGKQAISLERQVRIAAGSLVLLGLALSFVHPAFLVLSAFVGAGLVFSGLTDTCGMALILARMPWNRVKESSAACAS
jgi:rhodanese-related sulfurtransferase